MTKAKAKNRKSRASAPAPDVAQGVQSDFQHMTLDPALMTVIHSELFTDLDRQFALFMARLAGTNRSELVLAAALLSRARAEGHTCLDLTVVAGKLFPTPKPENVEAVLCPTIDSWTNELRATNVVGSPGEFKPLILDRAGRLYLHRYWEYEHTLATEIKRRASAVASGPSETALAAVLDRFFPIPSATGDDSGPDWQRAAARVAVQRQFCVISGGPGTGKTWTLVRILALLLELAGQQPIQIAVAAPTGKAAARVQEEIRKAKLQLACSDAIKAQLPERATTIHRLLGANRDATSFRFNRANPLPFDLVAIDEAGMVDLALMARLVDALAPNAKLILLGDKDQLASVEPGAVLGDICAGVAERAINSVRKEPGASGACIEPATTQPPLAGCIVQLQKNYRFGPNSQIYRLSCAINAGNAPDALKILREQKRLNDSGVTWTQLPGLGELKTVLRQTLLTGFADYFGAQTPADALNALAKFRVLCALRDGPYGVIHINRLAEQIFQEAGLVTLTVPFYVHRPIMITRNDYNLQLFNGDTGAILLSRGNVDSSDTVAGAKSEPSGAVGRPQDARNATGPQPGVLAAPGAAAPEGVMHRLIVPAGEAGVRAFFASADGGARAVLPARLPEHETAYAITVHKSQGSEFERVLVILPDRDVPLLTRELLYTAITRARKSVEIWAPEPVLVAAIQRRTTRSSGLRDALWSTT